jgi:hypothetical protein
MAQPLSRREFFKFSALAAGAIGTRDRLTPGANQLTPPLTGKPAPLAAGRVTVPVIYIYQEPSLKSERVSTATRDEVLNLLDEVRSSTGPAHNPLWYRLEVGYAHSGRIQRVELLPPNLPLETIPAAGLLGEITVPYVNSRRYSRTAGWQPLYRLYYGSTHWISEVVSGPDGRAWYRLHDTLLNIYYDVPATTVRPIPSREFSPLAFDVPPEEKHIRVSIQDQTLTAFEGDREVLNTSIASGIHTENVPEGELPTDTPTGSFHIQLKMPSRHMGDGNLTADIDAYELPGVPWTMVFHETGVALHGTYWHDNFGTRMSHGCINLRSVDAKWLFRWTDPVYHPSDWYVAGYGTLVEIV